MKQFFPKIIQMIPLLVLISALLDALTIKYINQYDIETKYWYSIILVFVNIGLYVVRFKIGVLFTLALIILGTLNVLSFFYETNSTIYSLKNAIIGKISTPSLDLRMLPILVVFTVVNYKTLSGLMKKLKSNPYW